MDLLEDLFLKNHLNYIRDAMYSIHSIYTVYSNF